jgi:hypothetical protein
VRILVVLLVACTKPAAPAPDAAPTVSFTLTIDGVGSVAISQATGMVNRCATSCTIEVTSGAHVMLDASSLDFATFSAPCPAAQLHCELDAAAAVTATFRAPPAEQDVFPIGNGVIYSVDFTHGGLVLGTSAGVVALDGALAPHAISPLVGVVRASDDGGIYVATPTGLVKLDASGAMLWSLAGTFPLPDPNMGTAGHPIAVMPHGGIAVIRGPGVDIVDAGGGVVANAPLEGDARCVATGPQGTIYVESGDQGVGAFHAFDAAGHAQPDFPFQGEPDWQPCAVAAGANQVAITQSSDDEDIIFVDRYDLARNHLSDTETEYLEIGTDELTTQVAIDPHDNTFWAHSTIEAAFPFSGLELVKLDATGSVAWSIRRPSVIHDSFSEGTDLYDVAAAPDGRVAVAGILHDARGDRGVVEIFAP